MEEGELDAAWHILRLEESILEAHGMTISLDEYRARVRTSFFAEDRLQSLRADVREAVRAHALTGSEHWDHYLEAIEARIAGYREMATQEHALLCDPTLVNGDKIMAAKIKVACFNTAIGVLEEVMSLPKVLIAAGKDASAKIKEFGAASE